MSHHKESFASVSKRREEQELSPAAQLALLTLARRAIAERLGVEAPAPTEEPSEELQQARSIFVTLLEKGRLRGCIGSLEANRPLTLMVAEMAEAAAFQDPRFAPVTPEEFDDLTIEISVLSPLERVESLDEIQIGEHGLLVRSGSRQGLLLPQVAVQNKWDVPTFLSHTCLKAGLPADAWRDPDVEIYKFRAQVFGEEGDGEHGA